MKSVCTRARYSEHCQVHYHRFSHNTRYDITRQRQPVAIVVTYNGPSPKCARQARLAGRVKVSGQRLFASGASDGQHHHCWHSVVTTGAPLFPDVRGKKNSVSDLGAALQDTILC